MQNSQNPAQNTLEINLFQLAENFNNIKKYVGKEVEVAATVKANGYGLGAQDIINSLSEAGCNKFFVFSLEEALIARSCSMTDEVFVYNGIYSGEETIFQNNNIIPVINSIKQLELWMHFAGKKATVFPAVIQVDTGMTRLGINYKDFIDYLNNNLNIIQNKLNIKYIISHLACAEEEKHPHNQMQLNKMLELKKLFPMFKYSLCNSAGIFLGSKYHLDLIRPGALLYGFVPNFKTISFVEEITQYYSFISQIRITEEEAYVGYDASTKVPKDTKLAVVAIGYADGYLRTLSHRGYCFIEDYKAHIVGKVSMDCIVIDVTDVPDRYLYEGAPVEILGLNSKIEDIAKAANACGWEILVSLGNGKRYKRSTIYKNTHY
jgi:alanine racemase